MQHTFVIAVLITVWGRHDDSCALDFQAVTISLSDVSPRLPRGSFDRHC